MNEIAIIEKQIAQMTDRLDRCAALIEAKTREVALLGYDLHIDNKDVEAQLRKLRDERLRLRDEQETLDGCVAELKRRLLLAQSERAAATAHEHAKRVNELLTAAQELAPQMDISWGKIVVGQAGGHRHEVGPKNPPLFDQFGNLFSEIFAALKATGLNREVTWPPPGRWGIGTAEDLRRRLEAAAQQYCGRVPSTRNFVSLTEALSKSISAALEQHEREQAEQTNREAA